MHPGQVTQSVAEAAESVAEQVPELAGLPVEPVRSNGTVVAPFRVGEAFLARFPLVPDGTDKARARLQAAADHALFLTGRLPVDVPRPVAVCEPTASYRGYWSVWSWVPGESLDRARVDPGVLARDLARLLRSFNAQLTGGVSFIADDADRTWNGLGRGGLPLADTEWVRRSIASAAHLIDPGAATAVWERALAAPRLDGPPSVIHGDPMPGNLVVRDGRLAGLIDITARVVGDPAADLQPAWTLFDEPERSVFRCAMEADDAAWERGRGWAFEMAIGAVAYYEHSNLEFSALAARTLNRLLEDE